MWNLQNKEKEIFLALLQKWLNSEREDVFL